MCVTNTVHRRAAVKLPVSSLSNSRSMVSQRLYAPVVPDYSVESHAKAVPAAVDSSDSDLSMIPQIVVSHDAQKRKRKRKRKPQLPGKTAKMNDRHFVVHNYHDFSLEVDVQQTEPQERRRGGVATAFPLKLHALLDEIEEDGLAHVVSWQPHGRAFVVHDPQLFVSQVMPQYFKQTRLTSFQRQLNLYGFNRITKGRDNGGYYHELFLRGKVFLSRRMTRTKVKGTKFKAASSPDSEPDFYQMPFVQQQQLQVEYEQTQSVVSNQDYNVVSSSSSSSSSEASFPQDCSLSQEQPQESNDLMLDFCNLWEPEPPVPTRLEMDGFTDDFDAFMPEGLIENDTQLGELLEALLEE